MVKHPSRASGQGLVQVGLRLLLSLLLAFQPCFLAAGAPPDAVGPKPASDIPKPDAAAGDPIEVSSSAETLGALPGRPAIPIKTQNKPVEDFAAVTIFSLPFTAFWALVGTLIIGGIAQNKFPPEFDTPMLAGAGIAAAGASVSIGLFSVNWSGYKAPTRFDATPTPTPLTTPQP